MCDQCDESQDLTVLVVSLTCAVAKGFGKLDVDKRNSKRKRADPASETAEKMKSKEKSSTGTRMEWTKDEQDAFGEAMGSDVAQKTNRHQWGHQELGRGPRQPS